MIAAWTLVLLMLATAVTLGVLRVLHAPLSGGSVEITRSTLPEYVAAIKRSTGILVARPS